MILVTCRKAFSHYYLVSSLLIVVCIWRQEQLKQPPPSKESCPEKKIELIFSSARIFATFLNDFTNMRSSPLSKEQFTMKIVLLHKKMDIM